MPVPVLELAAAVGDIQDSIANVLKEADPKAVVYNRWVQDRQNQQNWADMLRSDDDKVDGEPQIHAITVAFIGWLWQTNHPARSAAPIPIFGVDFFRQFRSGTDADNSEADLRTDLVVCSIALFNASDLNLREWVAMHQQLQMPPEFDVASFQTSAGDVFAHQAPGTINVLMKGKQVTS